MAKTTSHSELLDNEWYHVRYSGEIPEIALHSSIYYLTEDPDGPCITLCEEDLKILHDAASERYREIILRDITPANRGTPMYRGVLRTISNWRRYKRFCQRHRLDDGAVRLELAEQLSHFLRREVCDARAGAHTGSINCSYEDLASLTIELGVSLPVSQEILRPLCRDIE